MTQSNSHNFKIGDYITHDLDDECYHGQYSVITHIDKHSIEYKILLNDDPKWINRIFMSGASEVILIEDSIIIDKLNKIMVFK